MFDKKNNISAQEALARRSSPGMTQRGVVEA